MRYEVSIRKEMTMDVYERRNLHDLHDAKERLTARVKALDAENKRLEDLVDVHATEAAGLRNELRRCEDDMDKFRRAYRAMQDALESPE